MIKVAKKIIQNGEEIKLDIDNIAYEDLQGIVRLLSWGAIEESGQKEDGAYVKFGDGTMICYITTTLTNISIKNAYGSLYQNSWTWHFPEPFIDSPAASCGEFRWGSGASWGSISATYANYATLRIIDTLPRDAGTKTTLSAFAIGRWK